MRIFVLICIFITMILSGCDEIFDIKPRYNPERAGASIVESYDISGKLNSGLHDGFSDLAIYDDKIYILADGVINVFKKDKFEKLNEIQVVILNMTDDSKIEYKEIVVINEEKGFILCSFRNTEDHVYSLISVNVKTGDAELLDMNKAGIQTEEEIVEMGYDKIYDYIWFRSFGLDGEIYFYTFDALNNNFLFSKKISHVANAEDISFNMYSLFINGDEWFYTSYLRGTRRLRYVAAVTYNVNSPGEKLYFIDVQYLDVDGGAGNILYDEPYFLMTVRKDNKLQMLKLLPNE